MCGKIIDNWFEVCKLRKVWEEGDDKKGNRMDRKLLLLWLIGEKLVIYNTIWYKKYYLYEDKWEDICCLRFVETMNEMNDKKETWIRLNGWAR